MNRETFKAHYRARRVSLRNIRARSMRHLKWELWASGMALMRETLRAESSKLQALASASWAMDRILPTHRGR
jgi:hypothetical protein